MKTIAQFLNPEEARVAKSYLAANGVDAIISGEESLSVMPHLGMGTKGFQLMVADDDIALSQDLMRQVEQREIYPDDEVPYMSGARKWVRNIFIGGLLIWVLWGLVGRALDILITEGF